MYVLLQYLHKKKRRYGEYFKPPCQKEPIGCTADKNTTRVNATRMT